MKTLAVVRVTVMVIVLIVSLVMVIHYAGRNGKALKKVYTKGALDSILMEQNRFIQSGACEPDYLTQIVDPEHQKAGKYEPASFFMANLRYADFSNQDMRCASFIACDLTGANFFGADLRGVIFTRSDLSYCNLEDTDLRGTIFHRADLNNVMYEPKYDPVTSYISIAKNLNHLKFHTYPTDLYTLKKKFLDEGYLSAAKDVIASLNRNPTELADDSSGNIFFRSVAVFLRYIFFDLTCEFGSNPTRPLVIILINWILFSCLYIIPLKGTYDAGLYLMTTGETVLTGDRDYKVFRLGSAKIKLKKAISISLFYSFRNTFHLGFRDFDFGNWMRMIQPREFDIKTHGWPRTIAGIQSLLSFYLLSLSILSAFGTPFEF